MATEDESANNCKQTVNGLQTEGTQSGTQN